MESTIETARERIEQKRALAARVQELKDAMPEASERTHNLRRESEAAEHDLQQYIQRLTRRGDMALDEAELEQDERDRLATLRAKAKAAAEAHEEAAARYQELHAEIRRVDTELVNFRSNAGVDDLLGHQQAIEAAETEAGRLRNLITEQETIVRRADAHKPELARLRAQRQDLLAGVVMGDNTKEEVRALDARIAEAEQKGKKAQETATVAGQTIGGLARKLAEAERQAAALKERTPDFVFDGLMTEAEALGGEYAAAARELGALFVRLVALDEIIRDARGDHSKLVLRNSAWGGFFVPNFNLKAHANPGKYGDRATLFAANKLAHSEVYREAKAAELERLRDLGVTLI